MSVGVTVKIASNETDEPEDAFISSRLPEAKILFSVLQGFGVMSKISIGIKGTFGIMQ